MRGLFSVLCSFILVTVVLAPSANAAEMKEWTFMVFLNGHNNLDSYGELNLRQMETVGSTKDLNLVVQWASEKFTTTKRLYITKSTDSTQVTSAVVQELPRVDMGDWKQAVEFVKWTAENYPAKHYFFSYWNHGSGWHRGSVSHGNISRGSVSRGSVSRGNLQPFNISFDDFTNHSISTVEMGLIAQEAKKIIGHNLDIAGSDACLMAMAEVNSEMLGHADYAVASEETEPALGWPYDRFIAQWAAHPMATAGEVVRMLPGHYVKQFEEKHQDVTLSSMDINQSAGLEMAVAAFGQQVKKLNAADLVKLRAAIDNTQHFAYSDYVDLGDLAARVTEANIRSLDRSVTEPLLAAVSTYVTENKVTKKFARAKGVAFWAPTSKWTYERYSEKYATLKFNERTQWASALEWLLQK